MSVYIMISLSELVWFVRNVNYYLEIMLAGQEFSVPIVVINF